MTLLNRRLRRGRATPLRSQAVEVLRNDILAGRLGPGSLLNERDLADRLGVSKTPVREALTLLDHEGLVQTLPRKGYFVSPITLQDVHDFFGLRLILESAAAEMAAAKLTDEQLEHLSALVPDEDPAADVTAQLDRNVQFHHSIARLSGNERLAALIRKLLLENQRMIATAGYIPQEHKEVMFAFRERDPHRAAEAMRDHVRVVRDKVLRVAAAPLGNHPDVTAPR